MIKSRTKAPWLMSYQRARWRCINPNHKGYGATGIKFLMTRDDFKYLWLRDKANLMKIPSIDRINPKGNYTLENCRFIESRINSARDVSKKTSRFMNIYFDKTKKLWRGERCVNGKPITTKYCSSEAEAIREYKKKFKETPLLLKIK